VDRYVFIALGAALGANARYLVGNWASARWGAAFPFGTLVVNASGSLFLGFLVAFAAERIMVSPEVRLFLAVGLLGSYTTFSSYSVESLALLQGGAIWPALANIAGNNLLSLGCAVVGYALARLLGA
jgi:fluoride exporter